MDHFGDIYSAFFFDATLQDGTSRIAGTNIAIERFIRGATDYDMYVQSGADQLVGSLEAFVSTVFGTQLSDGEALGASVNALTNVAPAVTLTNIDSSSPGVLLLDLRQTFELDRLPPVPAPEPGTLAILAALGKEHELAMHIRATRNSGVTPAQLAEAFHQVAVYAGVPAANRAFAIAKQVYAELGVSLDDEGEV